MTTYELNNSFFEEYKSVDAFIRNALQTGTGVSTYIEYMEKIGFDEGRGYCSTWKDDYYKLKHMRWLRNRLAHDVGMNEKVCEIDDYLWLQSFYSRLLNGSDPLSAQQMARNRYVQNNYVLRTASYPSGGSGCFAVIMTMVVISIALIFILFGI